jgi:hypothetical protein
MNNSPNKACATVALICLMLGACSSVQPTGIRPGTWELMTADGQTTDVELSELRAGQYYLDSGTNPISGVYALESEELKMRQPDNPRMKGYVWLVRPDMSMVLVDEAPVELSGQRLVSSTLVGPK